MPCFSQSGAPSCVLRVMKTPEASIQTEEQDFTLVNPQYVFKFKGPLEIS